MLKGGIALLPPSVCVSRSLSLFHCISTFFSHTLVRRPQLQKRLAERYNVLSKPSMAVDALEEALAANKSDGHLMFELGKAYASLNQLGMAAMVFLLIELLAFCICQLGLPLLTHWSSTLCTLFSPCSMGLPRPRRRLVCVELRAGASSL